jgi:hypothetical protein
LPLFDCRRRQLSIRFGTVLHTREYRQLCSELGGFVEHDPEGEIDVVGRAARYETCLSLYETLYGQADAEWWPREAQPAGEGELVLLFSVFKDEHRSFQ